MVNYERRLNLKYEKTERLTYLKKNLGNTPLKSLKVLISQFH